MEKEQWIVLLSFVAGCIFTNYLGREFLTSYGILNDYFLSQYTYHQIDSNRLFCRILMERGRMAVTVFLFGRVIGGKWFSVGIKSIVASAVGFLLTVAIINLGIRGIPICLAALLPQWFFYIAVLFVYANCKKRETRGWNGGYLENSYNRFLRGVLLCLGLLIGIVMECYVNPVLLAIVLKIF